MKSFGGTDTNVDSICNPPDTRITLTIGTTAQAADLPDGTHIVRLTGMTTNGAELGFYASLRTATAALPTSGTTSSTANGVTVPIMNGPRLFTVPGSTGLSVIGPTAGIAHIECWGR